MQVPVINTNASCDQFTQLNREMLANANVFAVSVVGGPGCGKTTLIDATIQRLMPEVHVGVVACDLVSHRDADRMDGAPRPTIAA